MAVLIDCYNVLHETMPPRLAGLDEVGLCRALARSELARHGPVVVVCDGGPKPGLAAASPVEEVELLYAGRGRSADEEIIERIGADTAPRRLVVVSSDREIQKAARRRRARVLSAAEFVHFLASEPPQAAREPGGARSPPLSESEVERWLNEFGVSDAERRTAEPPGLWPPRDVDRGR